MADFIRITNRANGQAVQIVINRSRVLTIAPDSSSGFLVTLEGGSTVMVNRADAGQIVGGEATNL